jgi:hypothetical protein
VIEISKELDNTCWRSSWDRSIEECSYLDQEIVPKDLSDAARNSIFGFSKLVPDTFKVVVILAISSTQAATPDRLSIREIKMTITRKFRDSSEHYILAALVACLSTWTSAASSEGTVSARYGVLQNFSHVFGSKFTTGYFVSEKGKCLVTLRLTLNTDPETPWGRTSGAHVRLLLNPGQMAGLDSEEGQSLNLTCTTNATALIVDSGAKDALIATQKRAVSNDDFAEFVIP